jgi:hypothetical protein
MYGICMAVDNFEKFFLAANSNSYKRRMSLLTFITRFLAGYKPKS